ncbi:hypothetical protein P1J78_11990 [Psychromarinibacter sp. C21-152]|uniref:Uncharacterized protein n=1 Tax=Psychromarinibacter sediminicola TaxID=3033385 RepID=A0AAE3NSZ6_9RHOB|nr:hypothetical protein [Psychromarinibacter sediminicola]MDF0601456.1 hypothetical protein [Psychromarinibacter sediminicola]
MPVTYRIHRDLGLVHIRYEGVAWISESFEAVERYMQDPDFRPAQKQLVDLSALTEIKMVYAQLFALQAKKAEAFLRGPENLIVYYAPTDYAQSLARMISRSWDDVGDVVPVVHDDEAEALALLGLSETTLDALQKRSA